MKMQKMNRGLAQLTMVGFVLTLGALLLTTTQASAQGLDGGPISGYDQYTGPYAAFGISIGQTNGDDGVKDSKAMGGFNLRGGYRFVDWLAGEVSFIFMKGDLDGGGDLEYFAFTFGPKIYPVAFLDQSPIPEQLQPYTTIAIGGGEYKVRNGESNFTARFMLGLDYWLTDNIGAFMEGGYHVASEDFVRGTGVFAFGAQYRF